MPKTYAVVVNNLNKIYDNKKKKQKIVFENLSVEFEEGKIHCILGTSGCGKSTLLRTIAGLENYESGEIIFNDKKKSLAMIFQENNIIPWLTVFKNIEFSYISHIKHQKIKIDKNVRDEQINDLLKKYDLLHYKDYYPFELSGGLKQKVAIVKTLITNPDIILLDEAFSALDFVSKNMIHDLFISSFSKKQFTSILSTHDIREAVKLGDYIHLICGNTYLKIKNPLQTPRESDEKFDEFLKMVIKKYQKGEE